MAIKKLYKSIEFGTEGLGNLATPLGSSERDAKVVAEAMKSASEEAVIFNSTMKKINKKTHEWMERILVADSDFDTAMSAGKEKSSALVSAVANKAGVQLPQGFEGYFGNAKVEDVYMMEYTRKKMGVQAKKLAQEEVMRFGGTFARTNTDMVKIGMPVSKADYDAQVARLGSEEKAREYFGRQLDRLMTGSTAMSRDASRRAKEKEDEKKHKEEEKKHKQEEAEKSRAMHNTLIKVGAVLTIISNLVRRILSATLKRATEINQEHMQAQALGISYNNLREYQAQERSMGLREGLFASAIGGIQSAFGNITSLDEKSLQQLALVMGGSVKDLIMSGMGGERPEQLMNEILDAYYKRAQQGINSVGEYVGKEKAERELASALEKAGMKDLAEILRNMFYVNKSGIYAGMIGTATPTADYLNLTKAYTMGLTPVDYAKASALGQVIQDLQKRFAELKDNLETGLLLALSEVIRKINGLQVGKSPTEKIEDYVKARQWYESRGAQLSRESESYYAQAEAMMENSGIDIKATGYDNVRDFIRAFASGKLTTSKGKYQDAIKYFMTGKGNEAFNLLLLAEKAESLSKQAQAEATSKKEEVVIDAIKFGDSALQQASSGYFDPSKKGSNSSLWGQFTSSEEFLNRAMDYYELTKMGGSWSWAKYKSLASGYISIQTEAQKLAGESAVKKWSKLGKNRGDFIDFALENKYLSEEDIRNIAKKGFKFYSVGYGIDDETRSDYRQAVEEQYKQELQAKAGLALLAERYLSSPEARQYVNADADKVLQYTASHIAGDTNFNLSLTIVDKEGKTVVKDIPVGTDGIVLGNKNVSFTSEKSYTNAIDNW